MKTENIVKIMMGITGIGFLLTAAFIAGIFIFPNKNFPEPQIFVPHEAGQVRNPDQAGAMQDAPEFVVEETIMEDGPELISILDECHEASYDEVVINLKTLAPHLALSRGHRNLVA